MALCLYKYNDNYINIRICIVVFIYILNMSFNVFGNSSNNCDNKIDT